MFLPPVDAVLVVVMHSLYRLRRLYLYHFLHHRLTYLTASSPSSITTSSYREMYLNMVYTYIIPTLPSQTPTILPLLSISATPRAVRDALRFPRIPVALLDPGTTGPS